jgi:hypothetical protein
MIEVGQKSLLGKARARPLGERGWSSACGCWCRNITGGCWDGVHRQEIIEVSVYRMERYGQVLKQFDFTGNFELS